MKFDHKLEDAKALKNEGLSYRAIGRELDICNKTVQRMLDPQADETHKRKQKEFHHKKKTLPQTEERIKRKKIARFKNTLIYTKYSAKKHNYEPCDATVKQITDAFTGQCQICGIAEAKCNKKLCLDHCHKTGNFRGWLCSKCNMGLGVLGETNLESAIKYLQKG